ncbi:hypothetical protein M758_4G183500 [Ceratodon purpureus]|nr:hypothetical protein M758_4G183500 [Ceratodon purpureus]
MTGLKNFSGLVVIVVVLVCLGCSVDAQSGSWQLLLGNAGISSMHTAVTRYDTAIMLDRTNIGASQISLANGLCRNQPLERLLKVDCSAHSVMFDPLTNTVRPLFILTDTWCSSGAFMADGRLVQTGGDFEGRKKIRTLVPCAPGGSCDWVEDNSTELTIGRWYASNHILPDGQRQIVVGGAGAPSYEFVPKRTPTEGKFDLPLLMPGKDNLYPYITILPDGNLWIFAARDSCLLNYNTGVILRNYPTMPGQTRNYPAAGSMTLLPLSYENGFQIAEVLICGGSSGSMNKGKPAQKSCGRMVVTDTAPTWAMEDMPVARTMGDMVLLPDGKVLIINGAQVGSQGWGYASQPAFQPCLYATNDPANRFQLLAPTTIARVYHSTANLLTDGRVLLAGSNTHQYYTFNDTPFPTELRVEAFSPPYLSLNYLAQKPVLTFWPKKMTYGRDYFVSFLSLGRGLKKNDFVVECNLNSAPFVTHTYSMGQRQIKLKTVLFGGRGGNQGGDQRGGRGNNQWDNQRGGGKWGKSSVSTVLVSSPPNSYVAPSQYYMLFVVVNGIPGKAQWVRISP